MSPAPDVKFAPVGMGHFISFFCARCAMKKSAMGRKLQRVHGLRTWVCKGCANGM
jgi:hypothetical protein